MPEAVKSFDFMEAKPLLEFIEKYKSKIIGRRLTAVRSSCGTEGITDEAIVLSFDDISIVFYYYFYSDLGIDIVATSDVEKDPSLNFIYKDTPGSRNVRYFCPMVNDCNLLGKALEDISIIRFNRAFETNAATGEMRPKGGDYFRDLLFWFEGDELLSICAEDAIVDGYMSIHQEHFERRKEGWRKNPIVSSLTKRGWRFD